MENLARYRNVLPQLAGSLFLTDGTHNLQGKHAEIRGEADYEINLKGEQEIQQIHSKLDKIIKHLELVPVPAAKK